MNNPLFIFILFCSAISFGQCPQFIPIGPFCSGENIPALPTTSINDITGTWSPEINNTSTNTYTFTPASGQCATTTTLTIDIIPNLEPTFASVVPYCSGASIPALPITSTNDITGTWSPDLSNTATATYTFTPTAGQCALTASLNITINPNVTPTFDAVGPYCSGENIPALTTTSINGITGTWSPEINNTLNTNYTFTPASGQCATIAFLTIAISNPTPPIFLQLGPYCQNVTPGDLPSNSANDIEGTWSPTAISTNAAGTQDYTFTPLTGAAPVCAISQTISVEVQPDSEVGEVVSSDSVVCSGESANLSILDFTGSIQWKYSLDNNTFINISNATSSTLPIVDLVTTIAADSSIYYLAQVTSGVCASDYSDTISITIRPRPLINSVQTIEICSGDYFEFPSSNSSDLVIPENTLYNYTTEDNSQVDGELSGIEEEQITGKLTTNIYGYQSIAYNVVPSNQGCSGNPFMLNVNLKPTPSIVASDDLTICEGESIQLFAIDFFGVENTFFDWTASEQLSTLNFPYISNPTVSPGFNANYVVRMMDPSSGCIDMDTVMVSVVDYPSFSLSAPSVICGEEVTEVNIVGLEDLIYEVSVQNGELIGVSDQTISLSGGQNNEVVLTVTGSNSICSVSVVQAIDLHTIPNSSIVGSEIVCGNSFYQIYEVAPTSNLLFWQVDNGEIMNGQGTNELVVHWYTGELGLLSLTESDPLSGCSNTYSFAVSFAGLAPGLEEVSLLASGLSVLYCANSSFEIYKWGYTTSSSNQDFFTGGSSQYYDFGNLEVADYFYWVEYGNDANCLTRSYYNVPPIEATVQEETEYWNYEFYPNPVGDVLMITSANVTQNIFVELLSSTGALIDSHHVSGTPIVLDFTSYSAGMYFMKVITPSSIRVLQLVKQ